MSSNLGDSYISTLFGPGTIGDYEDSRGNVYITPRGGIKYIFNENHNIYASVSQGYKSGGFNTSLFYENKPMFKYDEETTINYEIGTKSLFLDGQVSLDTSVFYIDWSDQQVLAVDSTTGASPIVNAKKSRSYGADIALNGRFANGIKGGLGLGYADATYEDFMDAPKTFGTPGDMSFDASGNQQQYHSKFTAKASLGYEFALPWDSLMADMNVAYNYRSKFYLDPENKIEQNGYGTVDASVGVSNDTYEISIWARNIMDEDAINSAAYLGRGSSGLDGTVVSLIQPRTFGTTFAIKF